MGFTSVLAETLPFVDDAETRHEKTVAWLTDHVLKAAEHDAGEWQVAGRIKELFRMTYDTDTYAGVAERVEDHGLTIEVHRFRMPHRPAVNAAEVSSPFDSANLQYDIVFIAPGERAAAEFTPPAERPYHIDQIYPPTA